MTLLEIHEALDALVREHKEPGVRWAIYANPWRSDDCWFVAEDKPIEPYKGVMGFRGVTIYPAVPQGRCVQQGMPRAIAEQLVERLNAK